MKRIAALLLIATAAFAQPEDKPVEQTKKNITVLTGLPSSQLIPVMAFMSNSLGVTCAHCHTEKWESDEKPAKDVARRMLTMTRTLNEQSFESKPVVTCNTCHQGHVKPSAIPKLENAGWNQRPEPPQPTLPAAETIIDRYVRALGKTDKVTNRLSSGVVTRTSGRTPTLSKPFELYQELPGTAEMKTELPYPPEANRIVKGFFFGAPLLAQQFTSLKTIGIDGNAYVVEATPEKGRPEKLYFDRKSGLLLRRYRELQTPIGVLPETYDFADYRRVSGARVPFEMRWSRADYTVTHKFTRVQNNVKRPAPASNTPSARPGT